MPYEPGSLSLRGKTSTTPRWSAIDYQTGEILAYVGSAGYYREANTQFQPQFDVLGNGWRQPGSAFKPFNYVTGINDGTMTAATMFMDVTTNFGGGLHPDDADLLERGPMRMRQRSSSRSTSRRSRPSTINGVDHVFAGPRGSACPDRVAACRAVDGLGTEVHPIDLSAPTARSPTAASRAAHILEVKDTTGK